MCGRYTLAHSTEEILARFKLLMLERQITPRYNIAPSNWVPIIIANRGPQGGRLIDAARWGFVASWVRDVKKMPPMINARAESIAVKPFFRTAFSARRCIVPADGFYEWEGKSKDRKPWRIRLKNKSLMGFAGLYEDWSSTDGDEIRTCTIITTTANATMSRFHDRMPAILPRQLESTWLDPQNKNSAELESILRPYPDNLMECYRVSTAVNGTVLDGRELIEPVDPAAELAQQQVEKDQQRIEKEQQQAAKQKPQVEKQQQQSDSKKPKKRAADSQQLSLFDDIAD
jgi:putative SOS response-associated peptidase YedK